MGLFNKKKAALPNFDPKTQEAAVRKSICTGEMSVGFVEKESGRFLEVMRVNDQKELDEFCKSIGAEKIKTIY